MTTMADHGILAALIVGLGRGLAMAFRFLADVIEEAATGHPYLLSVLATGFVTLAIVVSL